MIRYSPEYVSLFTESGKRETNEDYADYIISPDGSRCLLLLADGMGGAEGGEVASRIAVATLKEQVSNAHFQDPDQILPPAFHRAHTAVLDVAAQRPQLTGMGCTLLAVLLQNEQVLVVNVGDSRAYQFRGDCVRRLTSDDLYISELTGVDDRNAKQHPKGHILSQAIGADGELKITLNRFDIHPDDTFLLCCDGVHDSLDELTMLRIIRSGNFRQCSERLVREALAVGSNDNCTALCASSEINIEPE